MRQRVDIHCQLGFDFKRIIIIIIIYSHDFTSQQRWGQSAWWVRKLVKHMQYNPCNYTAMQELYYTVIIIVLLLITGTTVTQQKFCHTIRLLSGIAE